MFNWWKQILFSDWQNLQCCNETSPSGWVGSTSAVTGRSYEWNRVKGLWHDIMVLNSEVTLQYALEFPANILVGNSEEDRLSRTWGTTRARDLLFLQHWLVAAMLGKNCVGCFCLKKCGLRLEKVQHKYSVLPFKSLVTYSVNDNSYQYSYPYDTCR